MMKCFNRIVIIEVVIALFVSLVGCNKSDDDVRGYETENIVDISFSWWGDDNRNQYTINAIEIFQQGDYKINVTPEFSAWEGYEKKYRIAMLSDMEADVMQINYSWLQQYSPDGDGYYDLSTLGGIIDLSQFSEDELSYGMINGKLNAIPISFNTSCIFYNEDILNQYGIEIPKTWDDLFDASAILSEDGIYLLGMSEKQAFLLLTAYFEQTTGRYVFDDDGTFLLSCDDVEYILEFYKKLLDENVLMPIEEWNRQVISEGTIAGSMFWISDINDYCELININGNSVMGSYIGTDDPNSLLFGWYIKPATMYAISSVTENPTYSAIFLNFLLNSPEMAVLQGTDKGFPTSQAAYDTLYEAGELDGNEMQANIQMTDNQDRMRTMIPEMENSDIIDAFKNGADMYVFGVCSPEDASSDIVDNINGIITDL